MLFYFCYSCLVFLQISAEVITLIKDDVVTCVLTKESVTTSTFYITNSIENITVNKNRNNVVSEWHDHDSDWQKGYSHKDDYGHVQYLAKAVYSHHATLTSSYLDGRLFDYFSMWVLVNPYCYLDITLESEDGTVEQKRVTGPIDLNSTPNWQQIVIYHHKVTRLYFVRGLIYQVPQGLWVVDDIRGYHAREIYYTNIVKTHDASQYVCKIDSALEVGLKLNCPAPHCNIQCSEILGPQYQHCESHKICLGSDCHCAWGYEGTTCKQVCQKGHWGLDCLQKCDEGCENCHHITSVCTKCKDKFVGATCSEELPVVLQPPEVLDVRDNQTLISINLEYGKNESKPEYFLIQYRELNKTESFQNYSQLETYENSAHKLSWLDEKIVRNHSYEFRVVLIYRDRYFGNRVPTLKLYNESSPPENLEIISYNSTDFLLTWDHPLRTNQKIKEFLIQVSHSNETIDILLNTSNYHQNYTQKIPISLCRNCTITVSSKNNVPSQNASVSVLVSKPIAKLSNQIVILWCSKFCHLLLANISEVVKIKNRRGSSPEACVQLDKFWKCSVEDDSVPALVVNGKVVKADFSEDKSPEVTSRNVIIIVGVIFVVIISSVIGIGLWCYKYKCKKSSANDESLAHDANGVIVRNSIYGYTY